MLGGCTMVQPPFLHLPPASGVASFGRRGGVHPSLPGLQPRRGCGWWGY